MLGGCTFALTVGGKYERIGATAYLLCWLFSTLVRASITDDYIGMLLILTFDVSLLIVFGGLTWKAPNNWPVWAMAFQLLVATLQFFYVIDIGPPISAYYTILNVSSVGIILALIIGTFLAWQERSVLTSGYDDLGRYS